MNSKLFSNKPSFAETEIIIKTFKKKNIIPTDLIKLINLYCQKYYYFNAYDPSQLIQNPNTNILLFKNRKTNFKRDSWVIRTYAICTQNITNNSKIEIQIMTAIDTYTNIKIGYTSNPKLGPQKTRNDTIMKTEKNQIDIINYQINGYNKNINLIKTIKNFKIKKQDKIMIGQTKLKQFIWQYNKQILLHQTIPSYKIYFIIGFFQYRTDKPISFQLCTK